MAWGAVSAGAPTGADPAAQGSPPRSVEALPVGSTVQFKTVHGGVVVGSVACFDPAIKILAVKDFSLGKPVLRIFNLNLISEIIEIAPATPESHADCSALGSVSTLNQASERRNTTLQRRKAEAMHDDVPLEGQRVFLQLRRTLDDVSWKAGGEISILHLVTLRAPYTAEAAFAEQENEKSRSALAHVRKILSKPALPDRRLVPCCKQRPGSVPPADPN